MKNLIIFFTLLAVVLGGILIIKNMGYVSYKSEVMNGFAEKSLSSDVRDDLTQSEVQGQTNLPKNGRVGMTAWVPENMPTTISAGGTEFSVLFESDLSQELRKAIIYDLNLIYGHLDSHEFLYPNETKIFTINGVSHQSIRFLKFTGRGRFFPNELSGKFGFMIEDEIVVPEDVCLEYKRAWIQKSSNEESYSALLDFIDRLNELSPDSFYSQSNWFYLSKEAHSSGIQIPDVTANDFFESFGGFRYRKPSLLEIRDGGDFDQSLSGKLIARIYVFDSDGIIRNGMPSLIHIDGEWRFFIGQPPA